MHSSVDSFSLLCVRLAGGGGGGGGESYTLHWVQISIMFWKVT